MNTLGISAVRNYIHQVSGITLSEDKDYLIESRLGRIRQKWECDTWEAFLQKLRSDIQGDLKQEVIDAITTNETYFYREPTTFELLKHKLIPDVLDGIMERSNNPALRIWCAACSSGQEAYTIAFILHELFGTDPPCPVHFMATDISDEVIVKASHGTYSQFEIGRGLDVNQLNSFFNREGDVIWRVKDEVRSHIQFGNYNLFDTKPVSPYPFDIIFCRNVMIYFSDDDKRLLYDKLAEQLNPGGALVLSHTESLEPYSKRFVKENRYHQAVYYHKMT